MKSEKIIILGTPEQLKKIWKMVTIPYDWKRSYGDHEDDLDNHNALYFSRNHMWGDVEPYHVYITMAVDSDIYEDDLLLLNVTSRNLEDYEQLFELIFKRE